MSSCIRADISLLSLCGQYLLFDCIKYSFSVRASRGSVFLGAAEEAEIDAILKAEASVFVHGVHTATMAPHSDREAKVNCEQAYVTLSSIKT